MFECPLGCGHSYREEYQLHLHGWASEKGYLPDCGKGKSGPRVHSGAEVKG
ncbi:hypothetical protein SEA_AEGEUS_54 [Mycobacterium phage Aegeus]|nr:hypothetical protein SEA_BAUDELAIRE_54 [Mycobacterium phage Baudelaire]WKW86546.1 hypothetical protein SEA_AEGEUS_54 [Mycobacterium phage Aegeus]